MYQYLVSRSAVVGDQRPLGGFGGIEQRQSNNTMVAVPVKTKQALMPIIETKILSGTTVIFDEWHA